MRILLSLVLFIFTIPTLSAQRLVDHVFIISFDGGKPTVIAESEMPILKKCVGEGAVTWTAQTIFPSKTLPSHTSMLTGLAPAKHHVLWNNYEPARGIILAPTVFALAKQNDPHLVTALFAGKAKFRHFLQTGSLDLFDFKGPKQEMTGDVAEEVEKSVNPAQTVAKAAAAFIVEKKPNLCFIHFPDPDSAGHKSGWAPSNRKKRSGFQMKR